MHTYLKFHTARGDEYIVGIWVASERGSTFCKSFQCKNQRDAVRLVNVLNGGDGARDAAPEFTEYEEHD